MAFRGFSVVRRAWIQLCMRSFPLVPCATSQRTGAALVHAVCNQVKNCLLKELAQSSSTVTEVTALSPKRFAEVWGSLFSNTHPQGCVRFLSPKPIMPADLIEDRIMPLCFGGPASVTMVRIKIQLLFRSKLHVNLWNERHLQKNLLTCTVTVVCSF